jgi:hypothetical protein
MVAITGMNAPRRATLAYSAPAGQSINAPDRFRGPCISNGRITGGLRQHSAYRKSRRALQSAGCDAKVNNGKDKVLA